MIKIGSHVSMSGREMLLASAKEAVSYDANTFMVYTGAPQNTKRKEISALQIRPAWEYMKAHQIQEFVVHAPYIINLANTVNDETYRLAVDFLALEIERTKAMGSRVLILHPGSHVGAGVKAGIDQIAQGLNEVLNAGSCYIALETMAGKGSEIGRSFEELAEIYDKVAYNDKLRVCLDLCHLNDAGYDVKNDFDGVIDQLDKSLGKENAAVIHINDSKNELGAGKDRHANIGQGTIGLDAIRYAVHHPAFPDLPKILETPYIPSPEDPRKKIAPYREEIRMLR
ncbi:MAG: deoxyribonuclease IV [Blautia sp.]|nr:deoxyribonuclease IV [Blautia sp.]MCM1200711.1 deoxyribonuclease IV [Bacteroides fragilis]